MRSLNRPFGYKRTDISAERQVYAVPEITEQELKLQLRQRDFSTLYILYGEEAYLKSFYAERICTRAVDSALRDFNFHRFEGKSVDWQSVTDAVEAFPMMSERTCVLLKDIPVDTLSESDRSKMMTILSDVPPTCTVVLWFDTVQVQPKKNAKWRTFLKDMQPHAQIVPLDKRGRSDLVKLLRSGAEKRGCTISADNAAYLITLVGDDLTNLLTELEKLCAFKQSGEITRADIDAVAVKTVDAVVFDLSKAMFAGDAGKAFSILSDLFVQKTDPVLIHGALTACYVDIYRVKVVTLAGGRAEDAASMFNYKGKEFRLRNAQRDGRNLSLAQVRQCLDILLECDKNLKGSGMDARLLLEKCITQLMLVQHSART